MLKKPKAVGLTGMCPHFGEAVEFVLTKKQIKAVMRAFKTGNIAQAEMSVEKYLGRDGKGDLKR